MGQFISTPRLSSLLPAPVSRRPSKRRSSATCHLKNPSTLHNFSCFRSGDQPDPENFADQSISRDLRALEDLQSPDDFDQCSATTVEINNVDMASNNPHLDEISCRNVSSDFICRCSASVIRGHCNKFARNISNDSGLSNPCISASPSRITDNENKEENGNDAENNCDELNNTCIKSTSIDRYMSALTDRLDRTTLQTDCLCTESAEKIPDSDSQYNSLRLKSTKRTKMPSSKSCSKQLDMSAILDCSCCSKDGKDRSERHAPKTGFKKKRWVSKFYNSKGNKSKIVVNSNNRSTDSGLDVAGSTADGSCVCTLYRKMEDTVNEVNAPVRARSPEPPAHNLTLGFARDRVDISTRGDSSSSPCQVNRMAECVSYEGSHYQDPDSPQEALTQLPFNITVARVYGQLQANSSGMYGAIQNNANLHGALQALLTEENGAPRAGGENNVILLSVGPQGAPVIDLSRLSAEDLPQEDCEERARVRRALEIAEGVEPPPGYRPHIQMVTRGELRSLLFQQQQQIVAQQQTQVQARIHTQVDYIHCLVPDLRAITSCSFYWGKMDRYEAERLLEGKPEGTFLLRDSAQEEYLFSVSFRKYGRSLHARIEQFNHKFSFDSHDPGVYAATTVTGLIEHYKDPACVMFFEPMLTAPLSRSHAFPLQHLCRAVIATATTYDGISELRLPPTLKAYLKEYHYRQRVRVKRFDGPEPPGHWQPPEGFRWEPEPNM